MTIEELYPLIKKKFETACHPNVKDDFDLIWTIHESVHPFTEEDLQLQEREKFLKYIVVSNIETRDDLLEIIPQIPKDARLEFYLEDTNNLVYLDIYQNETEDLDKLVFRLYTRLINWASMSNYALYRKIYLLKKENEIIKRRLKDEKYL